MDLHPASSYLRWLNQQLESLNDEQQQQQQQLEEESREPSSLRRLQQDKQESSSTQTIIDERRQILQDQMNQAISSLKDTGAAYASLTEFDLASSSSSSPLHDSYNTKNPHHKRHLKQSYNKLYEHNEGAEDYNTNWRRYSRYEWAEREGRRQADSAEVDSSEKDLIMEAVKENVEEEAESKAIQSNPNSVMGTSWKAVEISFLNQDTFTNNSTTTTTTLTPTILSANTHVRPLHSPLMNPPHIYREVRDATTIMGE